MTAVFMKSCEWNNGEVVEQEEMLCDKVETEQELTYLGDRASAHGGSRLL